MYVTCNMHSSVKAVFEINLSKIEIAVFKKEE